MRQLLTILLMVFCAVHVTAADKKGNAENESIKHEARFMADKIAYELKLDKNQLSDAYEINYDFLTGLYPILDKITAGDEESIKMYFRLLSARNSDLRWIMDADKFAILLDINYLYCPLYTLNGKHFFRIFEQYPDTDKFYFKVPVSMKKYTGEHARMNLDNSFYRGRYRFVFYGAQRTPQPARLYNQYRVNDFR